ncbi:MAG: hypothetical protein R2800_03935 [Flavipsychrobacter sp.]
MKLYTLFTVIAIAAVTTSCKKPTDGITNRNTSEMIIGTHPGFAPAATPSHYYLINNTGAYEDTTNTKPNVQQYKFDYKLSQAKYDQVKSLLNQIPEALLKENGKSYRSPNTADCSGNMVTTVIDGTTYTWSMEDCTEGMPDYVKPFADNVSAAVNILRQ